MHAAIMRTLQNRYGAAPLLTSVTRVCFPANLTSIPVLGPQVKPSTDYHHPSIVMSADQRKRNFSPGPAALPLPVLQKMQAELLCYGNTGVSVLEMSHRTKEYTAIIRTAEKDLKEIYSVPDNYKILFMQGGGTGQMAAVPLNLLNLKPGMKADYMVTGTWSSKAYSEAQKYGNPRLVFPKPAKFNLIPDRKTWTFDTEASYVYYCMNETIEGIEFQETPEVPKGTVLVCDMSSNFVSREIDISKFGVIVAGAQKNSGAAGVTMVIVREDLIGKQLSICPTVFNYKITTDNGSMYNTPPTYPIYCVGLVLRWILDQGGLPEIERIAIEKSSLIYGIIKNSNGFYNCTVVDEEHRSRMNVCLRIGTPPDETLEAKFVQEAAKRDIIQLKGHRSVGGLRFSLYNAVSVDDVKALGDFMLEFQKSNQ